MAVPLYSSQAVKSTVNNFLTNLFRGKSPRHFSARGSATAQHLTCKTACEKVFLNLKSLLKKAFVHGSTFVQLTSCKKHCEQFSYKLIQR
jgi:hypothetical protein